MLHLSFDIIARCKCSIINLRDELLGYWILAIFIHRSLPAITYLNKNPKKQIKKLQIEILNNFRMNSFFFVYSLTSFRFRRKLFLELIQLWLENLFLTFCLNFYFSIKVLINTLVRYL